MLAASSLITREPTTWVDCTDVDGGSNGDARIETHPITGRGTSMLPPLSFSLFATSCLSRRFRIAR